MPTPRASSSTPRATPEEASQGLLAALETRNIPTIRDAMAGYADAVQGVQLQSAAFELLTRVNKAKDAELDKLITEMRTLATQRRALPKGLMAQLQERRGSLRSAAKPKASEQAEWEVEKGRKNLRKVAAKRPALPVDLKKDLEVQRARANLRHVGEQERKQIAGMELDPAAKAGAARAAAAGAASAGKASEAARAAAEAEEAAAKVSAAKAAAAAEDAEMADAPQLSKRRSSKKAVQQPPLSKRQSSTGGLTGAMASLRTSRRGSAESLVAADEDAEMEEDEGEGDEEEEEGADPLADGKRWRSKPGKPGATRKARGAAASGVANPLDDLEDANPLEDGKRWRDKPSRPGATRKPKPKPDAQAKEQARQALPAGM